jgi:hypothetical protein
MHFLLFREELPKNFMFNIWFSYICKTIHIEDGDLYGYKNNLNK